MTKFLSHTILSHPTWGLLIAKASSSSCSTWNGSLRERRLNYGRSRSSISWFGREKTRSWNSRRASSREVTHTTTVGVTETQTRELAASLGLKTGKMASLNAELSGKFAIQTSLTEQRSVSDVLAFRNDGPRSYRLYALWSVRHDIYVKRLEVPMAEIPDSLKSGSWVDSRRTPLYNVSFTQAPAVTVTFRSGRSGRPHRRRLDCRLIEVLTSISLVRHVGAQCRRRSAGGTWRSCGRVDAPSARSRRRRSRGRCYADATARRGRGGVSN